MKATKKAVKVSLDKKVKANGKLGKFEKFDLAEKEVKEAEDAVISLGAGLEDGEVKGLITQAARDLEKAEAEIEEADEHCF